MARKSLKNIVRMVSQIEQDLPVEQNFIKDLERSIELTAKKEQRIPSKTYKPSGMNCPRSMYYQVVGKEPDNTDCDFTLVGICNSGTDIHNRMQNAVTTMQENGFDCEYIDVGDFVRSRDLREIEVVGKSGNETKLFHKGWNMSFLCDGIIKYKGKYHIIEFKTESWHKFQFRTAVNPEHYNQAIAYSLALGLKSVIFVYICRDNLDMKCFEFKVSDEQLDNLENLLIHCEYCKVNEQLPEKTLNDKNCRYCMYKSKCERNEV